ncbi:MAG TPA: hypothetical protein VG389_04965 [Myxococcota bacterium]|jgi:hypothetical protein|nr:hypothetical protein [Myxococcota bacterium]
MDALSPKARAILDAARAAHEATGDDRGRVRAALLASLGSVPPASGAPPAAGTPAPPVAPAAPASGAGAGAGTGTAAVGATLSGGHAAIGTAAVGAMIVKVSVGAALLLGAATALLILGPGEKARPAAETATEPAGGTATAPGGESAPVSRAEIAPSRVAEPSSPPLILPPPRAEERLARVPLDDLPSPAVSSAPPPPMAPGTPAAPAAPRATPRHAAAGAGATVAAAAPLATSSASTLDAETVLLNGASAALGAKDAAHALALLEDYARRFPHGVLAEEMMATRVLALCALGRAGEARAAAEAFLATRPRSPYAARVRASCGAAPAAPAPAP